MVSGLKAEKIIVICCPCIVINTVDCDDGIILTCTASQKVQNILPYTRLPYIRLPWIYVFNNLQGIHLYIPFLSLNCLPMQIIALCGFLQKKIPLNHVFQNLQYWS